MIWRHAVRRSDLVRMVQRATASPRQAASCPREDLARRTCRRRFEKTSRHRAARRWRASSVLSEWIRVAPGHPNTSDWEWLPANSSTRRNRRTHRPRPAPMASRSSSMNSVAPPLKVFVGQVSATDDRHLVVDSERLVVHRRLRMLKFAMKLIRRERRRGKGLKRAPRCSHDHRATAGRRRFRA